MPNQPVSQCLSKTAHQYSFDGLVRALSAHAHNIMVEDNDRQNCRLHKVPRIAACVPLFFAS